MSQEHPLKHRDLKATDHVNTLMVNYCLELQDHNAQDWIDQWLVDYSIQWITLAVVEALYLGRYKAVSVEQILVNWKRRGQICHHFTHEFERLISCRFPCSFRDFKRHPNQVPVNTEKGLEQVSLVATAPQASPSKREVLQLPMTTAKSNTHLQAQPLLNRPKPLASAALSSPESFSQQETEVTAQPSGFMPFIHLQSLSDLPSWTTHDRLDSTPVLDKEPILQFVPDFVPDVAQTALFQKLKAISAVSSSTRTGN